MNQPPTYTIIAAYGAGNRVIGKDNRLPWKIPSDLSNFKKLTKKSVMIMGHNTWKSLKCKALPGRKHIIVTSDVESVQIDEKDKDDVFPVRTLPNALMMSATMAMEMKQSIVFIIGGSAIYESMLPFATGLILTEVENPQDENGRYKYEGDSFFPDIGDGWVSVEDSVSNKPKEPSYTVSLYARKETVDAKLEAQSQTP